MGRRVGGIGSLGTIGEWIGIEVSFLPVDGNLLNIQRIIIGNRQTDTIAHSVTQTKICPKLGQTGTPC